MINSPTLRGTRGPSSPVTTGGPQQVSGEEAERRGAQGDGPSCCQQLRDTGEQR